MIMKKSARLSLACGTALVFAGLLGGCHAQPDMNRLNAAASRTEAAADKAAQAAADAERAAKNAEMAADRAERAFQRGIHK
jgi:hypothetical protein